MEDKTTKLSTMLSEIESVHNKIKNLRLKEIKRFIEFKIEIGEILEPIGYRFDEIRTETIWDTGISKGRLYVIGNDQHIKEITDTLNLNNLREDDIEDSNLNTEDYVFFYFLENYELRFEEITQAIKNSDALQKIDILLQVNSLEENLPKKSQRAKTVKI